MKPFIDNVPNHLVMTHTQGENHAMLDKGINPIGAINAIEGKRVPAILIRSTAHKSGSADTPWQDVFDVDNGHIRYYGDNKYVGVNPATRMGNMALLEAFEAHSALSEEKRKQSIPLIFYQSHKKGYIKFSGFGIIRDVQLITQYDRARQQTFTNYAFDFTVFSMSSEAEEFDWSWISARRMANNSLEETLSLAPASWKRWVKDGPKVLEQSRRRVSRILTTSTNEQQPLQGSNEAKALELIYDFYKDDKSRFEALASKITARIIQNDGVKYTPGWITPKGSDNGVDFYGRLNIGTGFGQTKIILLGQAKCESLNKPTGGNHIARTVARLRRGWIGAYVTTSYFSLSVQREIIEDEYPILLINGQRLARTALQIVHDDGYVSLLDFLKTVDEEHDSMVQARRPEELLLE